MTWPSRRRRDLPALALLVAGLILAAAPPVAKGASAQPPEPAPAVQITVDVAQAFGFRVTGNFDGEPTVLALTPAQALTPLEQTSVDVALRRYRLTADGLAGGHYQVVVSGAINGQAVSATETLNYNGMGTEAGVAAPPTVPPTEEPTAPDGGGFLDPDPVRPQGEFTPPELDFKLRSFIPESAKTLKRPYFDHHPVTTAAELSTLYLAAAKEASTASPERLAALKTETREKRDALLTARAGREGDWAPVLRQVENRLRRLATGADTLPGVDRPDPSQARHMAAIYEQIGLAFADLSQDYEQQRAEDDKLIEEYLRESVYRSGTIRVGPSGGCCGRRRPSCLWLLLGI